MKSTIVYVSTPPSDRWDVYKGERGGGTGVMGPHPYGPNAATSEHERQIAARDVAVALRRIELRREGEDFRAQEWPEWDAKKAKGKQWRNPTPAEELAENIQQALHSVEWPGNGTEEGSDERGKASWTPVPGNAARPHLFRPSRAESMKKESSEEEK